MITLRQKGNTNKTLNNLYKKQASAENVIPILKKYGERGVAALTVATPIDTGLTAMSWKYEIAYENNAVHLRFCNDNVQNGVQIAVILQYGHGTRQGAWVEGRDYINPAIQPVFDGIVEELWEEVH